MCDNSTSINMNKIQSKENSADYEWNKSVGRKSVH